MSSQYSVIIHSEESYHRTIKVNGFISVVVCFRTPPFKTVRFGFCLHCKELFSYTGALKHSKQLRDIHHIDLSRLFFPKKCDFYRQQIIEDASAKCEKLLAKESNVSNGTDMATSDVLSERPSDFKNGCLSTTLTV